MGGPIYPDCDPYYDPYCYYYAPAGGDLDGDGVADAIYSTAKGVSVQLGDGAGGLGAPTAFTADLARVDFTRVADFDGDGDLDLVLVEAEPPLVQVLLGGGAGDLPTTGPVVPVPGAGRILDVAVGTFDGGPAQDLVLLDDAGGATVLLGAAGGALATAPAGRQALDCAGAQMAAGFIDGDAITDIVVTDTDAWLVCAYMGGGTGAFTPFASPRRPMGRPVQPLLAELDGQVGLDLALLTNNGASVEVWSGGGTGGFTPTAQGPVPTRVGGHRLIAVPDPAAPTGPVDLAVLGGGILLGAVAPLPNRGDGTLDTSLRPVALTHGARTAIATDLDQDGRMDLLVFDTNQGTLLRGGPAQD